MKLTTLATMLMLPATLVAQKGKFEISGKLGKYNAPTKVYLERRAFNGEATIDTVVLKNGTFQLSGKIADTTMALLSLQVAGQEKESRIIYLEPAKIKIKGEKDLETAQVISPANKGYDEYKLALKGYQDQMDAINHDFGNATNEQRRDTAFTHGLDKRFRKAIKDKQQMIIDFIKQHPDNFFSAVGISELSVLNGMNMEVLEPLYASISDRVKKTSAGRSFEEKMIKEKTIVVGALAPVFTQDDINGKPVSLTDFRGKYVLLDFWASWCGPCRQENPNVLRAFHKYKDKNFMVLSVSLDKPSGKADWLKAIEHDGIGEFVHVSDLQYWSNAAAKLYGITGVPTNYLLGPDGKILAMNLRGEALNQKLSELLQ